MSFRTLSTGVRGVLAPLAHEALNLLFPPRCAACSRFGSRFCASCQAQVEPLLPPVCQLCGRPLASVTTCPSCRRAPSELDGARAASLFDEPLRAAIHHFKYLGARELATPLASLLFECYHRYSLAVDVLVPVPLHKRRQRERGFNQSALLARRLGQMLELPVEPETLWRERDTLPQVGLNVRQRRQNVAGAFRCSTAATRGLRVLLIDDVCTSGATLEACAAALRSEGQAASVWALTVARARGPGDDAAAAAGQSVPARASMA